MSIYKELSLLCGGTSCPTIYRTGRGTLIVQGASVAPATAGVEVPAGESLVEIPEQLFTEFAALAAWGHEGRD